MRRSILLIGFLVLAGLSIFIFPLGNKFIGVRSGEAILRSESKFGWENQFDFGTDLNGPRGLRAETGAEVSFDWRPGKLSVRNVAGSGNSIVDLGIKSFDELRPQDLVASSQGDAEAIKDHLYLVHFVDRADFFVLVQVLEIQPKELCRIKWVRLDGQDNASKASLSLYTAYKVKSALENFDPIPAISGQQIILQLRAGAGGGNPNRITMLGTKSIYVREVRPAPLDFDSPITMRDPSVAYVEGGKIPKDQEFVVRHIEYAGSAKGDSNGHGEFFVQVKNETIVHKKDDPDPISGEWNGEIHLYAGDEESVFAEIANSSSANVKIQGELRPRS